MKSILVSALTLAAFASVGSATILDELEARLHPEPRTFTEKVKEVINHKDGGSHHGLFDKLKPHKAEPTMWETVTSWFAPREPTFSEKLSSVFGGQTADMKAAIPDWWPFAKRKSTLGDKLFSSFRISWAIFSELLSSGLNIGLWAYDILVFAVFYEQVRQAIWGPSSTTSVVAQTSRVAAKALKVAIGGEDTPPRERWIRAGIGLTLFAPMLLAGVLFLVLPSMLFAVAVKNAIPVGIGIAVVSIVHALLHWPLSLFVNPTAVLLILYSYRLVGAVTILMLAHTTALRVRGHVMGMKAELSGRTALSQGQGAPQAGAAGTGMPYGAAASGMPAAASAAPQQVPAGAGLATPTSSIAASVPASGFTFLNLIDSGLNSIAGVASRFEGLVDSKLRSLAGYGEASDQDIQRQQPQPGQQQQPPQQRREPQGALQIEEIGSPHANVKLKRELNVPSPLHKGKAHRGPNVEKMQPQKSRKRYIH